MNAAKITLVSTIMTAALGLALGLMAAPAGADCPHRDNPNHKHCDGGDGGKPPKDEDPMGEPAVVVSAGKHGISEVQVFDVNGNGGQVVVKTNKDEGFHFPVWAPDGLHIALLTNDLAETTCRWSIRITTFDEVSSEWSIPESIICADADRPDWDPSGDSNSQRIYFHGDPDPDDGIFQRALAVVEFTLDANGNLGQADLDFPNITDDDVWALAVSPDGLTIAVTRVLSPDDTSDVALFDVATEQFISLLDVVGPAEETFWPNWLDWHPSGNYLTVSLSTDSLGSKIYCVDPLSGLAEVATEAIAAGSYRQDDFPTWSPDGSQFFFERDRAIARITFDSIPLGCAGFVDAVASSETDGRFEFLLEPGGKITGYGRVSVRLP